jgi:gluconokinase
MVIIFTGVSGAGKTTVGKLMAQDLGWRFYEGDDYHPAGNIEKMTRGVALTDEDRRAWLETLRDLIATVLARGDNGVVACSALKESYRAMLRSAGGVVFVHLKVNRRLVGERLQNRQGHFMNPGLIDSQFATLEEPQTAITMDAALPPAEIVRQVRRALSV